MQIPRRHASFHAALGTCIAAHGFQLADEYHWQVGMGHDTWLDVCPSWNEPLFEALRRGVPEIRLAYTSYNMRYQALCRWYTIDFTNRGAAGLLHPQLGLPPPRLASSRQFRRVLPQQGCDDCGFQPEVDWQPESGLPAVLRVGGADQRFVFLAQRKNACMQLIIAWAAVLSDEDRAAEGQEKAPASRCGGQPQHG